MKFLLSNTGFIFEGEEDTLKNRSIVQHTAFIIGASPAMIGDNPDKEQIAYELSKIKFTSGKKMISIVEVLILKTIFSNKQRINEYFKTHTLSNFHLEKSNLHITKYGKTGAILQNDKLISAAMFSMNNPHPIIYSRDFIGYFFEITATGEIELIFTDNFRQKVRILFSRIPVLAFKSENSTVTQASSDISTAILEKLTRRKHEVVFG